MPRARLEERKLWATAAEGEVLGLTVLRLDILILEGWASGESVRCRACWYSSWKEVATPRAARQGSQ